MKNVIIFNGGRGAKNIILSLMNKKKYRIFSIINAYDDGKSTGNLREIFNILGPSDIRKVQELFLPNNKDINEIKNLFNLRLNKIDKKTFFNSIKKFIDEEKNFNLFGIIIKNKKIRNYIKFHLNYFFQYLKKNKSKYKKLKLKDFSIINCIYASSILQNNNSLSKAINEFNKLFGIKESVLSISNDIRYLTAIEHNAKVYLTEAEIVKKRSNSNIKKIFLLKKKINKNTISKIKTKDRYNYLDKKNFPPKMDNKLKKIIKAADIIIYAPGTQHSSLYPTYMHKDLAKNIKSNKKAKKIFITNIGADYETPNYDTYDYLNNAYNYLTFNNNNILFEDLFNYVFINKAKKNINNNSYVKHDGKKFSKLNLNIIRDNFESKLELGKHDGFKIVKYIQKI